MRDMITQERIKELFDYDSSTGHLTRRKVPGLSHRAKFGHYAWAKDANGYRKVWADGHNRMVHRVIWMWVYGEWPEEIDHINHDPADNRLSNLRSVSHQENSQNQKLDSRNRSGKPGVRKTKNGKWLSRITVNQKMIYLGQFEDRNDAISARSQAEVEYGFHENHGSP